MKAASTKEIGKELNNLSPRELRDLCLRFSRFKKENKELLTYILFEASDEELYIEGVKADIDRQFKEIHARSSYLIRKSVRRILLNTRKFIRYSQKKRTEVELLLHFCRNLRNMSPSILRNKSLSGLYLRQSEAVKEKISLLHPDLQYDYESELKKLLR